MTTPMPSKPQGFIGVKTSEKCRLNYIFTLSSDNTVSVTPESYL